MTNLDHDLLKSWRLRLKANGSSPFTMKNYLRAATSLMEWLQANDLPTDVTAIRRSTLEAYQSWLTDPKPEGHGLAQASMVIHHNALKQLWKFLVDEEEVSASPMAKMTQPKMPDQDVAVFEDGDVLAMLRTCGRKTFEDIRDAALLRVLADTGCRRAEAATMKLDGLDLEEGTIEVMGKGSKPRVVTIGHDTAAALDRYLRARRNHRYARSDRLWLGQRGPISPLNVYLRVQARAEQAGLEHAHTHQFRHTWASNLKTAGVQSDELMLLAGWTSDVMVRKYGRATVKKRALQTGRRLSTMDRLTAR